MFVQNMRERMEGKIAPEGLRRQEDNQKLKEEMSEWMKGSNMTKVPGNWCRMI